jgi:hypothetical protein
LSQEEPKEPDTDTVQERDVRQSLLLYYSSKVSDHGIYLLTLALIAASVVSLPIGRTLQVPLLSAIVTITAYELYRLSICGMLSQAILFVSPVSRKEIGTPTPPTLTIRMNEGAVQYVKKYPVKKRNPQTWPLALEKWLYLHNFGLIICHVGIFVSSLYVLCIVLK